MNILLIGNGFDLAHGLPTKYTDFLEFVKVIKQIINPPYYNGQNQIEWGNLCPKVRKQIEENMGNVRNNLYSQESMWKDLIGDNIWIDYFLQNPMYQKENWIDFENEISKVIQSLDGDMHGLAGANNIDDNVTTLSNSFLNERYSKYTYPVQSINMLTDGKVWENIMFKEIRNKLLNDLNKLIRALEIYLCEYVEKMKIKKKSPDIDKLEIGAILSFNYTHIYSKLYSISNRFKQVVTDPYDFIHGEANIDCTIESNNMVLGIDEYLPDDRKNTDIEFIAFKKYYQRIYNQTGCRYKGWVDQIIQGWKDIGDDIKRQYNIQIPYEKVPNKCRNQLFIFGHSLDATDGDILRELILKDNVYTTIFYHNKKTMGQQIANLVKVIGQDELIRRTGGSTKTIEFKLQQDMIPVENSSL